MKLTAFFPQLWRSMSDKIRSDIIDSHTSGDVDQSKWKRRYSYSLEGSFHDVGVSAGLAGAVACLVPVDRPAPHHPSLHVGVEGRVLGSPSLRRRRDCWHAGTAAEAALWQARGVRRRHFVGGRGIRSVNGSAERLAACDCCCCWLFGLARLWVQHDRRPLVALNLCIVVAFCKPADSYHFIISHLCTYVQICSATFKASFGHFSYYQDISFSAKCGWQFLIAEVWIVVYSFRRQKISKSSCFCLNSKLQPNDRCFWLKHDFFLYVFPESQWLSDIYQSASLK